ncbi:MAG: hypothetical protein LUG66_05190 [Clostridiales bacterium]|nr:hypothetical protein [Clostridiales bacterium]
MKKNFKGKSTGNSIYYFENMENIKCTAFYKSAFRKDILKLEGSDGFLYKVIKTKGNFLEQKYFGCNSFFCRKVKCDLVRKAPGSDIAVTVGKISFPQKGNTEIVTDNHKYELTDEGGGYYSVKTDGLQNALFKLEAYVKDETDRYCGWYEREWEDKLGMTDI